VRAQQNRAYVQAIEKFARLNSNERLFVYDDLPDQFHHWGVTGALKTIYRDNEVAAQHIGQPGAQELIQKGDAAWLHWNRRASRLDVVRYSRAAPIVPYLTMDIRSPVTQLLSGWYPLEDDFRWTKPDATAILFRPEGASNFEVMACVRPEQMGKDRAVSLQVLVDAQPLGAHEFASAGCETVRWPVPAGHAGPVKVEFHSMPPYQPAKPDLRILGVTMKGFGFTS
jgi:hypothetical protein